MVSPSHNNRMFGPGSSIYHLYTRHIKVTNLRTQYLVQINKQMQATCAHQNLLHTLGQPDCSLPQKLGKGTLPDFMTTQDLRLLLGDTERQMLLIPGSLSCLSLSVLSCCKTT